jgi:hypothetical protein
MGHGIGGMCSDVMQVSENNHSPQHRPPVTVVSGIRISRNLRYFIRDMNKHWANNTREAEAHNDSNLRFQTLVNTFHMVRLAAVLMHPIAPEGTEMILEYLNLGKEFWNWERIFEPIYSFMDNPQEHKLKFLEPRVDLFKKHATQIEQTYEKMSEMRLSTLQRHRLMEAPIDRSVQL